MIANVGNDSVALGLDGFGKLVVHDLDENAMGLVIGRQGSGKSVGLSIYAASALLHGYHLALIEPSKGGVDFGFARPYIRPSFDGTKDIPAAVTALQALVAEGERRRSVQREAGVPKNSDLPAELRSTPVLILVDELTSMVAPVTIPKGLQPADPERVEAEELNVGKARIQAAIEKIAREFRYVGFRMIVGTQRFAVSDLGAGAGALRENCGVRILNGSASTTAIGMAFMDPQSSEAAFVAAHGERPADVVPVGDGVRVRGRAIAEIEGKGHIPFQGFYAGLGEIARQLREHGVPTWAERLAADPDLAASTPMPAAPTPRVMSPDVARFLGGALTTEPETGPVVETTTDLPAFTLSSEGWDSDDDAEAEEPPP